MRLTYTPESSTAFIFQPLLEEHCNSLGQIRAGYLLKLIDVLGAFSALQYVDNAYTVVTASLDRTNFINTIRVWEFIYMESTVTQVWNTSMEVMVDVYAVNYRSGPITRRKVARAYLVFVAIDKDAYTERKKAKLPPLQWHTAKQLAATQAADLRKKRRFAEDDAAPWIALDTTDGEAVFEHIHEAVPDDANLNGNVFGGVILELMSRTARKAAEQHCLGQPVVGARVDRMSFIAPGFIGETIRTRAIVTQTWTTSMELQVEVQAINPNQPDTPRHIASCYMVFVRVTDIGRPADVPQWLPQTPQQTERQQSANTRRKLREKEGRDVDAIYQQSGSMESLAKNNDWTLKRQLTDWRYRLELAWSMLTTGTSPSFLERFITKP